MAKSEQKQVKVRRSLLANCLYAFGGILFALTAAGYLGGLVWDLVNSFRTVEVPALTGRVVDAAGVLSPADVDRVTAEITSLESATRGGQMAILTVPTTRGDSIEAFGLKVAGAWKIGRKGIDDGAVLVIAVKDRRDRLEIGRGWEGPVNDARAGDILRAMAPYLKACDYAGASILAVRKVKGFVTGSDAGPLPAPGLEAGDTDWVSLLEMIGIWLGIGFLAFGAIADPNTPSSGSHGGGSWHGGSTFGGGGGGGGFSGDDGSFGGGGASGRW